MCILSFKSMTHAAKAKRILEADGINAEIISLEKNLTRRGCGFGISFNSEYTDKAMNLLKKRSLAYGELLGNNHSI